jgi:hypothetical protein
VQGIPLTADEQAMLHRLMGGASGKMSEERTGGS